MPTIPQARALEILRHAGGGGYWSASASMGEMRAARREGSRQAASETAPITAAAAASSGEGKRGGLKQHGPHGASGQPRSDAAEQRAARQEAEGEGEKLHADLFGPRAQGHAHADLAAALRDGVAQYAIGADGDQEHGDERKDAAIQAGERCATRLSAIRSSMERRS